MYEGEWKGLFGGKGTLSLHEGTTVDGFWRSGEYIGKEPPSDYQPVAVAEKPVSPSSTMGQTKVWAIVVGIGFLRPYAGAAFTRTTTPIDFMRS